MNIREDYEDFLKFRENSLRWRKERNFLNVILCGMLILIAILCFVNGIDALLEGSYFVTVVDALLVGLNVCNLILIVKRSFREKEEDVYQDERFEHIDRSFRELLEVDDD